MVLPFNKGWDDGAGNPPNPSGLKTDYLWKQVLTRDGLTDIIENYAQVVESKDDKTGRKTRDQIWLRYHQLDVVRRLLADASVRGASPKYLIQHSAGSGKSNSIAWLAHQLIGLERDDATIFDTVIVVKDRRVLDRQIRDTIRQFAQVGSIVGHAETSGHLQTLLREGKRIVITTVQKVPFILDAIGNEHRGRRFAIIIDEAHSSQGGRTSASVSMALGEAGAEEEDETTEDKINRLMESRKLLANASYFAFTATPKNKTLEIFGTSVPEGGNTRHVPFHPYTMKQAIQERFIIDVLKDYTPVNSYYRLVKTVEGDPEFDTKRAGKKLRRYVEDHDHAIRLKAEIMVDHFHEQVAGLQKIGGQARAMVVTSSIQRAITYFYAIRDYLAERKSPYQAIAAFSGEHEHDGARVTESSLNGFSSQAQRALTQLVGWVMRQPHARRTGREALDQCYVYCCNIDVGVAVAQVKNGLEQEGLTGLGDAVLSDSAEFHRIPFQRREAFRNKDIFLPLVLHKDGSAWDELDYQRHILPGIDWTAIESPDPQSSLPDRARWQWATVDVGETLLVFHADRELYIDKTVRLSWYARRLADLIPNPWQAGRISRQFVEKLRVAGQSDDDIHDRRSYLAFALREYVTRSVETQAGAVFKHKLGCWVSAVLDSSGSERLG